MGPPFYKAWVQPLGRSAPRAHGRGDALRLEEDEPGRPAQGVPRSARGDGRRRRSCTSRSGGAWASPRSCGATRSTRARSAPRSASSTRSRPVIGISLCVFNAAVIVQEFALLLRARARAGVERANSERPLVAGRAAGTRAHARLAAARSRAGATADTSCHFGIVLMFMGFTGQSWNVDREASLFPGQTLRRGGLHAELRRRAHGGRQQQADGLRRRRRLQARQVRGASEPGEVHLQEAAGLADDRGRDRARAPRRRVPHRRIDQPGEQEPRRVPASHQPARLAGSGSAASSSSRAAWCACGRRSSSESRASGLGRAGSRRRRRASSSGSCSRRRPRPRRRRCPGTPGTVRIETDTERFIFGSLRCMCGTCARDLLSTCTCETAEEARDNIRAKLLAGEARDQIIAEYAAEFGPEALAVPPNTRDLPGDLGGAGRGDRPRRVRACAIHAALARDRGQRRLRVSGERAAYYRRGGPLRRAPRRRAQGSR